MTDLINQLMNDEAVHRTTPATPGLLIMHTPFLLFLNFVFQENHQDQLRYFKRTPIKKC